MDRRTENERETGRTGIISDEYVLNDSIVETEAIDVNELGNGGPSHYDLLSLRKKVGRLQQLLSEQDWLNDDDSDDGKANNDSLIGKFQEETVSDGSNTVPNNSFSIEGLDAVKKKMERILSILGEREGLPERETVNPGVSTEVSL